MSLSLKKSYIYLYIPELNNGKNQRTIGHNGSFIATYCTTSSLASIHARPSIAIKDTIVFDQYFGLEPSVHIVLLKTMINIMVWHYANSAWCQLNSRLKPTCSNWSIWSCDQFWTSWRFTSIRRSPTFNWSELQPGSYHHQTYIHGHTRTHMYMHARTRTHRHTHRIKHTPTWSNTPGEIQIYFVH